MASTLYLMAAQPWVALPSFIAGSLTHSGWLGPPSLVNRYEALVREAGSWKRIIDTRDLYCYIENLVKTGIVVYKSRIWNLHNT